MRIILLNGKLSWFYAKNNIRILLASPEGKASIFSPFYLTNRTIRGLPLSVCLFLLLPYLVYPFCMSPARLLANLFLFFIPLPHLQPLYSVYVTVLDNHLACVCTRVDYEHDILHNIK